MKSSKKQKILLISTSKEKIHDLEFSEPIKRILKNYKLEQENYKNLTEIKLSNSDKIIICGTSLQDNEFLESFEKFNWIKIVNKPVLGICAGFQIIGKQFEGKLKEKTEIGFYHENINNKFLGLEGKIEVYHLHNNYLTKTSLKEFKIFDSGKVPQAIKHKKFPIYATLFHPEVRNKGLIIDFVKNG